MYVYETQMNLQQQQQQQQQQQTIKRKVTLIKEKR